MDPLAIIILWLVSGFIGAAIGRARDCQWYGFAAGLLLGPLGWLLAFLNDQRAQCPECVGRIPRGGRRCCHCGSKLYLVTPAPKPDPVDEYKAWKASQDQGGQGRPGPDGPA